MQRINREDGDPDGGVRRRTRAGPDRRTGGSRWRHRDARQLLRDGAASSRGDIPRDREPIAALQVFRANPVAGPVFVNGVGPGDTLVVELEDIAIRDWGWTGILEGFGPMAGRTGWEELNGPFGTIIRHEPGPSSSARAPAHWPMARR